MSTWAKEELTLQDGTKLAAQMPVCHYCYANTSNAATMENTGHCECPHVETIIWYNINNNRTRAF